MNTKEDIDEFLNFIQPRPCFANLQSEIIMVEKQKQRFRPKLFNVPLTEELRDRLKDLHFNALITPGECVGIAGAQSLGEFSTQATLNTFHSTGFDSGVGSTVDRFQEIINASKNPKNIECKIYFTKRYVSSVECKDENRIVGVTFNHLIKDMWIIQKPSAWHSICHIVFSVNPQPFSIEEFYVFRYSLNRSLMYKHALHPFQIKERIERLFPTFIVLFSPLCKRGRSYVDLCIPKSETLNSVRDCYLPKIESTCVSGIENIEDIIVKQIDDEFIIETLGGSFQGICHIPNIDMFRTTTNNIWDLYHTLGIEAVSEYLLEELTRIMNGVQIHNISLLVSRMTYHGTISGITRYTMRNECGTLSKASFEESMETFLKSAKFGEIDSFKGISAEIIGGHRPSVGTNVFQLKLNLQQHGGNKSD